MIFVNLPSTDLDRSRRFYTALGCTINPTFSDDTAICVVWDDTIYFMVLTREKFQQFTNKELVDPFTQVQTLVALSRDSGEHVDSTLEAGIEAGGKEIGSSQDYGFMYMRTLEDPDGNVLEFSYMDPRAAAGDLDAYTDDARPASKS